MPRPQTPVAIITGASRGIGLAIARALTPDHELVLVARSEKRLEQAAMELTTTARVRTRACDLADPIALEGLLESVADLDVRILINNAGIAPSGPIARTDDETWARTVAINLTAPFWLCRAFAPRLAASGWGRIINVASTAGLKGYRYTAAYAATKHGVVGLTRALALDVARKGVTVNAVCPGFTDTDIVARAVDNIVDKTGATPDDARASIQQFSPQGRLMSPEEVAALVAYLCSEAANGITGQALAIDGGETA